jgi:hypothetical protein
MRRLFAPQALPFPGIFMACVLCLACLAGCKPDCRESVRMGDFEFSQGNYVRAEKLYGDALRADPSGCADAEGKRANALRFLNR